MLEHFLDIAETPLFDRMIDVTFYHVDTSPVKAGPRLPEESLLDEARKRSYQVKIECPSYGYKPSIDISYKLLPNHICYQVTVKITNFSLRGDINIRDLNVMEVVVGYRGQKARKLTGPIFSSYQESPNPDGVTVFEGVVTGESGVDLLASTPYEIEFNESEVTVNDLCERIAIALNLHFNKSHISTGALNTKLHVGERLSKARADNGYAVLSWLNNVVHAACLNWDGDTHSGVTEEDKRPPQLFLIWGDGELAVIEAGFTGEELSTEQCVILKCVKTISFAGPAMTLQALYDPVVESGTLIYVDPIYFTGGTGLPNIMSPDIYNADKGLYRVITVDVQFSTTGNTNNMSLLAVPLSNNRENIDAKKDYVSVSDIANNLASVVKIEAELVSIKFGERPPASEEDKPKNFWDQVYNPSTVRELIIEPGDTLSTIARREWKEELIYFPDNKLTQVFNRTLPLGVPIYHLYPLIALATYVRGYKPMQKASFNPYYINIDDMDSLQVGKKIIVPVITVNDFTQWLGNGQMISIFESAKDYYEKQGKFDWAKPLSDVINYLKYGKK